MKWIDRALTLLIGIFLHAALAYKWQILGVSPDVFAAFLVCLAFMDGPGGGALVGALGGLYLDVIFLYPGYYTIAYLALGALAGIFAERSHLSKWIMSGLLLFVFTVVKQFLTFFIVFLMGGSIGILGSVGEILTCAVYTTLLFYVIFVLSFLFHRIPLIRRWSRTKDDWEFS
ncbi:MAG: rod shape-determining protein MreD [Clostridia bacterium]|nr:rod shape-determining protein MreD [Clostridia bacterium]